MPREVPQHMRERLARCQEAVANFGNGYGTQDMIGVRHAVDEMRLYMDDNGIHDPGYKGALTRVYNGATENMRRGGLSALNILWKACD